MRILAKEICFKDVINLEKLLLDYVNKFNAEQSELYSNDIKNKDAAKWLSENIPLFECEDKSIEETYYFRWWTYRKHIKHTKDGYVITEFLPNVLWSRDYNTIVCPVSHHISEGRWLKNSDIIKDYIRFYMKGENCAENRLHYSNYLIYSAYEFCIRNADMEFAEEIFPELEKNFADWEKRNLTKYGLFWSHDNADGMEYSISGDGLRVTINSYMYAASYALWRLCVMLKKDKADYYKDRADAIKKLIYKHLWDGESGFFKNVYMESKDSEADFERADKNRDVLEQTGYIPWCFDGLCDEDTERAFSYLTDEKYFKAPYGITTAQMNHPLFMKNTVRHECLWDGPVWPFATSQTLTGIYKLLGRKKSKYVSEDDFCDMLSVYAKSQHINLDGKVINWIDEDIDPFSGEWISRKLIMTDSFYDGKFPDERGANYNHSVFCDLVLSGACGIDIGGNEISVNPLCKNKWSYFAVRNINISGNIYDIYYDRDNKKYNFGNEITVFKNGQIIAKGNDSVKFLR